VPVDPHELHVELDGGLSIRRGEAQTHGLLLTNLGEHAIKVATNGSLTARVVAPSTGATVGCYTGWQHSPLIYYLLVGTASFTSELG
jgi:hypothetical protein